MGSTPVFTFDDEPEIVGRHQVCPQCQRNTLDTYADGVVLCDGPGCDYHVTPTVEPQPQKPVVPAGPSRLVTVAELREQLVPPRQEGVQVESMETVQARPISWLWKGRIPRGMLTLIVGDPGLGKSQVTLDWAARVSRGLAWSSGEPGDEPRNVMILSAEDVADMVLKPRLLAAGADVSRIKRITSVLTKERVERMLSFETDVQYLATAAREHQPSLIIIDPINAYLGKSDTYKDNHVRSILAPLLTEAERVGAAVVGVMHQNKDGTKKAIYRTMGSIAFVAASRSCFMVSEDPDNKRVLFTHSKSNLAKKADALAYVVEDVNLGDGIETSRIVWQAGSFAITSDEAQNLSQPERKRGGRVRDRIIAWLEELLAAGPVPVKEISAQAETRGYSWDTVKRAKDELGVVSEKTGAASGWTWQLSDSAGF